MSNYAIKSGISTGVDGMEIEEENNDILSLIRWASEKCFTFEGGRSVPCFSHEQQKALTLILHGLMLDVETTPEELAKDE